MKIFLSLFVCCFLIEVNADCWYAPPGYGAEDGKIYKDGDELQNGKCFSVKCDNNSWVGSRCAEYHCIDQIGNTGYNYSKPFPECCPRPICKSDLEKKLKKRSLKIFRL
ncbi:GSCOCG00003136001-RA-CDS [Cotesia congregata]|uniref:Single domain-containing protein n=1 Tax=Cotesia congregata TaxID=51543 RepID=A0A8J2HQV9_COTCN|nr:GSCOCG00003136001-RA-CDS [Cotesia congregata]CAG5103365.1 Protein of unknown function [Cotesia congregata]